MYYAIFLDDEREPGRDFGFEDVVVARTVAEAQATILSNGVPAFISFDHDLGPGEPTGHDFAKWLVESHLDGVIDIRNLAFYVHSQNPIGAENITMLLSMFLASIQ